MCCRSLLYRGLLDQAFYSVQALSVYLWASKVLVRSLRFALSALFPFVVVILATVSYRYSNPLVIHRETFLCLESPRGHTRYWHCLHRKR